MNDAIKIKEALFSPNAYIVRRGFGRSLEEVDLRTTVAFMGICGRGLYNNGYDEPLFLVASMMYKYCKPGEGTKGEQRFEYLLRDTYRLVSDSSQREIRSFFEENIDGSGRFQRKFFRLCGLINSKVGLSTVNYGALLYDFSHWNDNSGEVRYKWAAVTLTKEEKNNNKEK